MATATKKKPTTVKRKKKTAKQKKKDSTLNLFVKNENASSGIELVHLDIKHRRAFIERFGLLVSPNLEDFNEWAETLS